MFQKIDVLTLAQATTVLDGIETRLAQFAAAGAKCGTDLMDAEARLGEAVLDGDTTVGALVANLRIQADGLTAALVVLERRRMVAQLNCKKAQAVDFRRQAAWKQSELTELEAKTRKLLSGLSELEKIEYTPCILGSQRAGAWVSRVTGQPAEEWESILECGSDPLNSQPFATPKSRRLRDEADALERQAADIEMELRSPEPMPSPAATPAAGESPASHTGPCACGVCRRARAAVPPAEWAAAGEAGNAGAA